MQNLSKIDTAKDLVTKEWVEAQDFLPSSAFTKNGIKNALGIADWALAASKPSYDDVYLKLAGGTISGNLTVSGQFKAQTSLASVSLLSNIFDVNASLKVQPGWNLYLNGEAIMKWSDLSSKINAVRQENGITPTASPNAMGYAGGGEGWPVGGPVMVWGTGSYFARLCVNIWETNPTMLISCLAGADATEWATFVTSLNVEKYAMKVESGILSGANLNELMAPGAYNTWASTSNNPTSNNETTILVIASKTNYMTSQILTDAQGHLYSRMNEGGTWRNWRTILDTDNIATTSLSSLNLNGETINSWGQVRTSWEMRVSTAASGNNSYSVDTGVIFKINTTLTSAHTVNIALSANAPSQQVVTFTVGSSKPTISITKGSTTIKWENGTNPLSSLQTGKTYRIQFDGNLAMYSIF